MRRIAGSYPARDVDGMIIVGGMGAAPKPHPAESITIMRQVIGAALASR